MSKFTFLAKQGQHNRIARLLTQNFGKPRLSLYNGRRGEGVMIELEVQSKRAVNRFLSEQNVLGAVMPKSHPILTGDSWDVQEKAVYTKGGIGPNVPFKWVQNGKFKQGLYEVNYHDYGCTCCGGYYEVRPYEKHGQGHVPIHLRNWN